MTSPIYVNGQAPLPGERIDLFTDPSGDRTRYWDAPAQNALRAAVSEILDHTSGWVNVRSYGAKGDGTTDDTAAITAALNAGAKNVFLPAGTYKITGHLAITNGQGATLRGAGKNATTLQWTIDAGAADKYALLLDANVAVEGLRIKNAGNDVTASIALVSNAGASNGFHDGAVRDVIVEGFGKGTGSTQGLTLGMMFNLLFEGVDFVGCGLPVEMGAGSNNARFVRGSISGTKGNRIIKLVNASTVTFTNVAFEPFDAAVASGALIAEVVTSPNVSFRDCYYEPSYGLLFDSSPGYLVDGSLIEGFDWTVGSLTSNAHVRATNASNAGLFSGTIRGRVAGTVSRAASNPANSYAASDDNTSTATVVEGVTARDANLTTKPAAQMLPAWTPSLVGAGGTSAHTYTQRTGYYVRDGQRVTAFFRVALSAKDAGMTGAVSISGLPFPVASSTLYAGVGSLAEHGAITLTAGYTYITGEAAAGASAVSLVENGSAVGAQFIQAAAIGATATVVGEVSYLTTAP